jgi:hypothetical protein
MDREEVVKELRSFRNAWEKITTRDQDLSNERLKEESLTDLRKLLKFYYTEDAKTLAKQWLNIPLDVTKPRRSRQRRRSGGSSPARRTKKKSGKKSRAKKSGKKSRAKKSGKKSRAKKSSTKKSRAKKSRSDRPSPKLSATLFDKGQIKKGNDGNKWTVIVTSSGIHRWKRV